jgi:hypothetical protein
MEEEDEEDLDKVPELNKVPS